MINLMWAVLQYIVWCPIPILQYTRVLFFNVTWDGCEWGRGDYISICFCIILGIQSNQFPSSCPTLSFFHFDMLPTTTLLPLDNYFIQVLANWQRIDILNNRTRLISYQLSLALYLWIAMLPNFLEYIFLSVVFNRTLLSKSKRL